MTQTGNPKKNSGEKLIASNPTARSNYTIIEVVESGIALTGTEVKSLRSAAPNLRDAYVEVRPHGKSFEAWLFSLFLIGFHPLLTAYPQPASP